MYSRSVAWTGGIIGHQRHQVIWPELRPVQKHQSLEPLSGLVKYIQSISNLYGFNILSNIYRIIYTCWLVAFQLRRPFGLGIPALTSAFRYCINGIIRARWVFWRQAWRLDTEISSFGILRNSYRKWKKLGRACANAQTFMTNAFKRQFLSTLISQHLAFPCMFPPLLLQASKQTKFKNGRKTHSIYVSWRVTLTLNSFQDACARLAPSRQIPPPDSCRSSKWLKP